MSIYINTGSHSKFFNDLRRMGRASFCETHHFIRLIDGFRYAPKKAGTLLYPPYNISPFGFRGAE